MMWLRVVLILLILAGGFIYSSCDQACAYLIYGSSSQTLYIDQPIKLGEWKMLQKFHIERVAIMDGADGRLFASERNFPHLKQVSIYLGQGSFPNSPAWLSLVKGRKDMFTQLRDDTTQIYLLKNYLLALSKNYRELQSLSIGDGKVISDTDIGYLNNFHKLRKLALSGLVENTETLATALPNQLVDLDLSNNGLTERAANLPLMRKLSHLRLSNCVLGELFFCTLNAPNLRTLNLENVQLNPGSLRGLRRFDKLTQMTMVKTSATQEMLQQWSKEIRITRRNSFEVLVERLR